MMKYANIDYLMRNLYSNNYFSPVILLSMLHEYDEGLVEQTNPQPTLLA